MKVFARNRKAFHLNEVTKRIEAGLVLTGTEVKSIRSGKVNFADAFGFVEKGEVFLRNLEISPYEKGNIFNHPTKRKRKLLFHANEIVQLQEATDQKGLTLVPLSLYLNKRGKIKVEMGLCRGKKLYDKRQKMSKRESGKIIKQALQSLR